MKLLVFGGIGFIGTNVCLTALSRGHQVIAFDNLSRSGVVENLPILSGKKGFTFLHGDVRCSEDFYRIPKGVDVMINLAANPAIPVSIQEPLYDFTSNVLGHIHILEYSRTHGSIPIILASSNKAYTDQINELPIIEKKTRYLYKDPQLAKGFDETTDVSGHLGFTNSPYGAGKLADEKYTREYWKHYKIPMVINRMSCLPKETSVATIGGNKTIHDLLYEKKPIYVYSFDDMHGKNTLTLSKVNKIWKTGHKKIFEVKTNKSSISATENHLFRVERRHGQKIVYQYIPLSELVIGDRLVTRPFLEKTPSFQQIELPIENISSLYHGKKTSSGFYKKNISRKLSALFTPDKYEIIARLMGYFFGDGHLGISYDKANNKNVYNTCVYGDEDSLTQINNDLVILGFRKMPIERKWCESHLSDGRIIKGTSIRMRSGSSDLFTLFYLLGCPVGDKTEYAGGLPWFVKKHTMLTREFLRGFFDAELAEIKWQEQKGCWSGLSLVITKRKGIPNILMRDITNELDQYAIQYSPISVKNDFMTTKGVTNQYVLNILKNKNNLNTFTEKIGFAYNLHRQESLYLACGNTEIIDSIRESGEEDVYDLEIDKTHNFFANSINVHNCIYGLYQKGVADQGWVDHFLRVKKYGGTLTLYGTGKQVRDVLFSTDVAELYVYEAEHMTKVNGKTFNVGGGVAEGFNTSLLELIDLIDEHFPGKKLSFVKKSWRESDQRIYISDIRSVSKVTGWKPKVSLVQGLKNMWQHYG